VEHRELTHQLDQFLVCGLGNLGQHCVFALKEFGVRVNGINLVAPTHWDIPGIPEQLGQLVIGDARQESVLKQANLDQCRAVLIVTSEERVNAETALAIRKLSPNVRLVVRSSKENLNHLLAEHLGNFIAFEPTQLPASAFAVAALGTEVLGFFSLDNSRLQVIQRQFNPGDSWCYRGSLQEFNSRTRRILCHSRGSVHPIVSLPDWEPETQLQAGDQVIYIEVADRAYTGTVSVPNSDLSPVRKRSLRWRRLRWEDVKHWVLEMWQSHQQQPVRQVAIVCGAVVLALLAVGTLVFARYYPGATPLGAFYGVAILLLGQYGELFGDFEINPNIPGWLQFFAFVLTLAGTALVGVLYALLTQGMLSTRFQLTPRRPPIPLHHHTIVVGLGRVGQQVVRLLQEFRQPLVGVTFTPQFDLNVLSDIPIVRGSLKETLNQVNLGTARSVVVVTDDDILNLEISLMARSANPSCHLVIRTKEQSLTDSLNRLLPGTHVICAYGVTAEAFAAAAFGEKILGLFRCGDRTILVTEYEIEVGDTLDNLLLTEVAYGYGVVPILHQRKNQPPRLMPPDEIQLTVGDRMVVLATIEGLRAVEDGIFVTAARWQVRIQQALSAEAVFEGANLIVRICGFPLNIARSLMSDLPVLLPRLLFKHQAYHLIVELKRVLVIAQMIPPDQPENHYK
jgi:K+ transport systems, NAD-binding component